MCSAENIKKRKNGVYAPHKNPTAGKMSVEHDKNAKTKPPIRPITKPYMKNLNSIMPSCAFLFIVSPFLFFLVNGLGLKSFWCR
jgi:hypothetical protein